MSANSEVPPRSGPLPPDPGFLELCLTEEQQERFQASLRDLGILQSELPEVPWAWTFWSAVAARRLMRDLQERNPGWSETRVRTSAAHALALPESTLRRRLNELPGR